MEDGKTEPPGPDLTQGIAASDLPDGGKLRGHVGEEQVLLARRGAEIFALGAVCTHYSGPLAEGLIVDDTIRCPWHHACFSLRTGEALHAPALSPVDSWLVDQKDGKIIVREKRAQTSAPARSRSGEPGRIVIVGGGAAGFAAAEMLRRRKYRGRIVMLSADDSPPSTGLTCPRTFSRAARRRIGCLFARPNSSRQRHRAQASGDRRAAGRRLARGRAGGRRKRSI